MKALYLALFLVFYFTLPANAVETPIPAVSGMEYTITIKKFELYNSTTGQWVTATSSATSFDIASVTAGATAGNMINGAKLTNGTYTKVRVTVSNQFRIKAFVSVSGQGKCTSGNAIVGTNTFAGVANCSDISSASSVTCTIDFSSGTLSASEEVVGTDLRSTNTLPDPFTIGEGSAPKTATVSFDMNNVFKHYSANHFSPGSPEMITPGQPAVTQSVH